MDSDCALKQVSRDLAQLATRPGEDDAATCLRSPSRHRLSNAEAIERSNRVREKSDPSADHTDARRPLQHNHLMPCLAQADRRAQSSNPSPDYDHTHDLIIGRRASKRNRWRSTLHAHLCSIRFLHSKPPHFGLARPPER